MISNTLDFARFRQLLLQHSRVQIPDFLQTDAADELHACLRDEVRWETAQRTDATLAPGQPHSPAPGSAEDAAMLQAVRERALAGFEFYFDRYRMIDARRDGIDPDLVLHVVVDFLNSEEFLAFARYITGDDAIQMVSAIGARYRSGHFLRLHNDKQDDEQRTHAYVINLSRDWLADWGGLLEFVDPSGKQVLQTFTPHWNSLSLFKVPQLHQVTPVNPWARSPRLSITGWFRRG